MFGSFGSDSGQFNLPRGVAVTKEGQVMIADTGNGRIQVQIYIHIVSTEHTILRSL